eukprot:2564784-Rhodomonas_salina.2
MPCPPDTFQRSFVAVTASCRPITLQRLHGETCCRGKLAIVWTPLSLRNVALLVPGTDTPVPVQMFPGYPRAE